METIEFKYCGKDDNDAREIRFCKKDEDGIHDYDICDLFLDFMMAIGYSEKNILRFFSEE